MKRILLTGMSGTGKSSVIGALADRGYRAIDLGEPDWSEYDPDGEWIWREARVRDLLATDEADTLFVSGCAENQVLFHAQFDHIILLSAPPEIILERLRTRTNNRYGKDPAELTAVLGYLDTVEPLLRRVAGHEIDTAIPLADVVTAVLEIAGR